MEKYEIAKTVYERREAALALLDPQWKACAKTKPRGHIYDGTTGHTHFSTVCLYCGKPHYHPRSDVRALETYVAEMGRYPIALALDKNEVAA